MKAMEERWLVHVCMRCKCSISESWWRWDDQERISILNMGYDTIWKDGEDQYKAWLWWTMCKSEGQARGSRDMMHASRDLHAADGPSQWRRASKAKVDGLWRNVKLRRGPYHFMEIKPSGDMWRYKVAWCSEDAWRSIVQWTMVKCQGCPHTWWWLLFIKMMLMLTRWRVDAHQHQQRGDEMEIYPRQRYDRRTFHLTALRCLEKIIGRV